MRTLRFHLHNPLHSHAPAAMKRPKSTTMPGGGSRNNAASSGIASRNAVTMRCLSMPRGLGLLAGQPESALTGRISRERERERGAIEIRPRDLGEIELGVRQLPK